MHRILFAMAALAALIAFGAPARAQQADVACSSIRDARMECPLNGRVAEIKLLRQTSEARCIADRTWGVSRGKLWVDQGCAGVFRVFYELDAPASAPPADGQIVACASMNHRLERCAIPRDANWIRLRNRTSDAACIWGGTWSTERGAIWVDRGCGGRFELSYARRAPGGDWHEIASGGGRPDPRPAPAPVPAPYPGQGGHYDDDRADRRDARIAVRLCRRYGEDRPDLFDARWVVARHPDTFRVDIRGRDLLVEGVYDVVRRGRDEARRAVCRVRGARIAGFTVR
mgnify:CR=1 FL=1